MKNNKPLRWFYKIELDNINYILVENKIHEIELGINPRKKLSHNYHLIKLMFYLTFVLVTIFPKCLLS